MTPPRLPRRIVRWLAPPDVRAALVDDLDEAFARQVERRGPRAARRWYWRQALGGWTSLMRLRVRGASSAARIREAGVDASRASTVEALGRDLKFALRSLSRSPGFTAIALLSLALGIGLNTVVFSVVDAVLLRPLPYAEPDRLVLVTPPDQIGAVNLPQFEFWRAHATVLVSAAGHSGTSDVDFSAGGPVESVPAMRVTSGFFATLGVPPALGREFQADDMQLNGPRSALLSDALWRRVFGAEPSVLGRTLRLGEASYVVVGVLPRTVWLPEPADVFIPLRRTGEVGDIGTNTEMIARLAPGVSVSQAAQAVSALDATYLAARPGDKGNFRGLTVMSYQRALAGDARLNLLLLFSATGALLLLACTNLAGLLLARLAARRKEIALRLALGATRARVFRQFVFENLLVGVGGGVLGAVAAYGVLDTVLALVPFDLTVPAPFRIDRAALAFAAGAGVITAALLSLAPLVAGRHRNLHESLKATSRAHGGTRASRLARSALVVSEVALSGALLVGAALFGQTLYRLTHEPLGFTPDGVLTFSTPAERAWRSDPTARARVEDDLTVRLKALPGVTGVGITNVLPLAGWNNFPTQRDGHPDQWIGGMEIRAVSPSYFQVMGMPIVSGRGLTTADVAGAPHVIVVSETVARRWWPGGSALGDRVVIGRMNGRTVGTIGDTPRQVVGVVADTKTAYLSAPPRPTVYVPWSQAAWMTAGMNWAVRGDLSSGLADRVRQTVAAYDPQLRVARLRSMDAIVASASAASRFDAWLSTAFAAVAVLLAAVGLYGLLAFSVARRTSEIGTRIALGATRGRVVTMILREGLALVAAGLALGLGGAAMGANVLSSLLFGVRPLDPPTFIGAGVLLLVVGFAAALLPARRASVVDPLEALRSE